jgi:ubiquinone/menaquinone biosynthesis C-methylase UbiE
MDTRREEIAATFDRRASGYRDSDWHRASAGRLVDLCDLKPGDRVLDAGTGTGFAALHAARKVGQAGHVVGVDISQGMLSEARAEAAASRLTNIEFIQCDATSLPQFADSTFDVVDLAHLHPGGRRSSRVAPVAEAGRPHGLLDDVGRLSVGGTAVS